MANAAPTAQELTLVDACLPRLTAGAYEVTVRQTVIDEQSTFAKSSVFHVAAPRFSLAPSEIYATYPRAEARGLFADTLPHVVFKRRTLPWERSLVAPTPEGGRARPWMALLLLDQDDLGVHAGVPLRPKSRTLSEVGPRLTLEPWERPDDRCTTLDIPGRLFAAIAPSWDDLPYLAHARHVGRTEHMEADGIEDEGWFSVVVGNRTPVAGKEHAAFLVSLEGLETVLPRAGASPSSGTVRVVVLASWRFTDETEGKRAGDSATWLSCGPFRLAPPNVARGTEPEIASALESGYAPLDHQTRQGHRTVSWYRGPFVPKPLLVTGRNVVYSCADAALRYDRHTGLLDVSYAAAWQLGRLLGLRDASFTRAIHRLKLRAVQAAADAAARAALAARFGDDAASDWTAIATRFLAAAPPAPAPLGDRAPCQPADRPDPYDSMRAALAGQGDAEELPLEIRRFIGRLYLLHGVPLGYLVPHPGLLPPPESLRTFYLDTSWLAALLDGALGIGRVSDSLLFLDKGMTGRFVADVLRDQVKAGTPEAGVVSPMGFLLRSELVAGWKGLEIRAEGRAPLRVLRLERLARDTMLGIYDGRIERIVITQPTQGMHFGAKGAPLRKDSVVVDLVRLAKSRGATDQPALLARSLLVNRVQHTVNVTIARNGVAR